MWKKTDIWNDRFDSKQDKSNLSIHRPSIEWFKIFLVKRIRVQIRSFFLPMIEFCNINWIFFWNQSKNSEVILNQSNLINLIIVLISNLRSISYELNRLMRDWLKDIIESSYWRIRNITTTYDSSLCLRWLNYWSHSNWLRNLRVLRLSIYELNWTLHLWCSKFFFSQK